MSRPTKTRPIGIGRWLVVVALCVVILGAAIWGIRWAYYSRVPLPEAIQSMTGDERVAVTTKPWLTFTPTRGAPTTGFVFYPGGQVDPRSYAVLMQAIASEGYLVVVPPMPFNIAVFRPNVAAKIVAAHPEIRRWAIGGHSVGGAMAAQFTHTHSESIDGLAIWASYPPGNADLSGLAIPALSIYGSREITVTDESVAERKHLLPPDTRYVRIEGGDHHQFGSYVIDPGEHRATLDRAAQHEQIVQETLALLKQVSEMD